MVWYYSRILHRTWIGMAVGEIWWLWPIFETLHFFGMVLLIGVVGAIDLRMLGAAKALPLRPLSRLLPWAMLGFAITFVTGIGLYAGNPDQYQTWAFLAKMTCVVLALINGLHFSASRLHRQTDAVQAGGDVPLTAKLAAAVSLILWFGVIFWGRMLAALGPF